MGTIKTIIKSNLSLYSLYYAEACKEFVGPISASHCSCKQHSSFQRNAAAASSRCLFDSTGARFEPRISHFKDERVTARPTGSIKRIAFGNYFELIFEILSLAIL